MLEFQKFVDVQPHNILAPGQTRWLSLRACVQRLLEQWDALTLYFIELSFSDPTQVNDMITNALNNKLTQAYLEFLDYNLGKLNAFNTLFQLDSPNIFNLRSEICSLIRSFCTDFMRVAYVKNATISLLNPSHPTFTSAFVPVCDMYIGVTATETISEITHITSQEKENFFTNCRGFLIEAVSQIHKRFNMKDPVHDIVRC